MSNKLGLREIVLAVVAIGLIGAGIMLKPDIQQTEGDDPTHPMLADGLKQKLNEINALEISRGDNEKATIAKDVEGIWRVKELYGYPASTAEIRKALLYLSQSELREKKTDDTEKMDRIGLNAQQVYHVRLKQNIDTLYHIMLGNPTRDATGTYVQVGKDTQSYVASGRLELKANPHDWLFYELFSVNRARVKRITYDFIGKKDYEYVREKTGEYMILQPQSDDIKLKDRPVPLNPSYYFERMQFTDVLPESKITSPTEDVTTLYTFDGLILKVHFHMIDFKDFVHFSADVDSSLRDASAKDLLPLSTVQQEANAINERTKGWLYKLGQFHYNQLRSSYFDLVTH